MNPTISVVIATRNRTASLLRLLRQLREQTVPPADVEIVVVDDGSTDPVAPAVESAEFPFAAHVVRTGGRGPGAARHAGVLRAHGEVVVFVDDDMQVDRGFLEAHLGHHRP